MKRLLVAVFIIALIPTYTTPQKLTVEVTNGFLKGRDYLDMDTAEKRAYAMGAINGMLVAPLFLAPQERVKWLETCTANMTDDQIAAILTKYLRDNPGEWHRNLNVLTFNAMSGACPKSN